MSEIPLLEISDLSLNFRLYEGISRVLNGVNMVIRDGARVALVGESGCGKSLLARTVLGLPGGRNVATAGEIRFRGENVLAMPRARRRDLRGRRISMIFQDPMAALNPVFTIADQMCDVIARGGQAHNRRAAFAIAREALAQVAIDEPDRVLASYPFQISGGMAQRVLICMALVNRPDLVLADEPGTSLDVTVQEQTLRLMTRLTRENGAAVLLIAHNLGVVRAFAEKVYVMYAGSIVEEGSVDEVFRDPRHPYTQALFAAVPRLTGGGLPRAIGGMVPDYTRAPEGCRFHPRCAHARADCRRPPPKATLAPGHSVHCILYAGTPAELGRHG